MKPSRECIAALERFDYLAETLGRDHAESRQALELVMALAPIELQAMMHAKALELGLTPPASGYLADATPVYRLKDVAARLGLSEADASESLKMVKSERAAAGLDNGTIDPESFHWKQ